jgi:putative colanic acid biosynthesis glycosyltransferase WcaI
MRILHLGMHYWPDETGIAPFNAIRCEFLAAQGHEVTVVTGFPFYPQWRVPRECRGRARVREEHNGVKLIRSWLYVPRRVSSFKRVVHEASFSLSALASGISQSRPDVIFVVSPPLALAISAWIFSWRWRTPYTLHVEDLQPDAAVDLGMLRSRRLTNALYALERMAYRNAAAISTINEAMANRICSKGVAREKVAVVPHGVELALFDVATASGARLRHAHRLEGKFLVVHAGNMGVKQGLELILDAAAMSRDIPEISYLLVGDGVKRSMLERRAAAANLRNVRFMDLLPRAEFRELLAAADLSLVTQQRCVTDIVFPSKVETLMAAGRPILASLNSESAVAAVLRNSGAGEVVEPENPRALLDGILGLQRDRSRRVAMGVRGREYARIHWDRDRSLHAMESILTRVGCERGVRGIPASQPAAAGPG